MAETDLAELDEVLSDLGNIISVNRQLKNIDQDTLDKLIRSWELYKDAVDRKHVKIESNYMFRLLRNTAYVIIDTRYQKINNNVKLKLIEVVIGCSGTLGDESNSSTSIQQLLINLQTFICQMAWRYPAAQFFEDQIKRKDPPPLTDENLNNLWSVEGWIFLEARIDFFGKANRNMLPLIARLLSFCIRKCNEWYPETDLTNQIASTNTNYNFSNIDPFKVPFIKYVEYIEAFIVLYFESNETGISIETEVLTELPPCISSHIIRTLRSVCKEDKRADKVLPRLWNKDHFKDHTNFKTLLNLLVPAALKQECNIAGIRSLLELWLKTFLETTEPSLQLKEFSHLHTSLLFNNGTIKHTDNLYVLGDVILETMGHNKDTRSMFVMTIVLAMNNDVNKFEAIRTDDNNTKDEIYEVSKSLSDKLLNLALFFREFHSTKFQLTLTAFSLNPTEELFQTLFPFSADSTDSLEIEKALNIQRDTAEDLQLSQILFDDLDTIITKPRWGALAHFTKGFELMSLCKTLLDEKDKLIKKKELEQYERVAPNSTGVSAEDLIERNYIFPHKKRKTVFDRRFGKLNHHKRKTTFHNKVPKNRKPHSSGVVAVLQENNRNRKEKVKNSGNDLMMTQLPSRPIVEEDVDEKLIKLKQFYFQKMSVKEFQYTSKATYQQFIRKAKQECKKKFLSEKKALPKSLEYIPYPDVVNDAMNSSKSKTRKQPKRVAPTAYVCPKPPFKPFHGIGECEVEFRSAREKILSSFPTVVCVPLPSSIANPTAEAKTFTNILPQTNNYEWALVEQQRNERLTVTSGSLLAKMCPSVKLFKDDNKYLHEIESLAKEYLRKKEQSLKAFRINKENPSFKSSQSVDPKLRRWVLIKNNSECTIGTRDEGEKENNDTSTEYQQKFDAVYRLGEIWECTLQKKAISPPIGPKKIQEKFIKDMMVKGAIARLKNNLKLETYKDERVLKDAEMDEKTLLSKDATLGQNKIIQIPIHKDLMTLPVNGKMKKTKHENIVLSDTYKRTAIVSLGTEDIIQPMNFKPRKKGRPRKFSLPDTIETNKQLTNHQSNCSELPSPQKSQGVSRKRKNPSTCPNPSPAEKDLNESAEDSVEVLSFEEFKNLTSIHELQCSSESEPSCSNDRTGGKREYQYYSDELIYKAYMAILKEKKTLKDAADMFKIKRSALCKRLHVKGLRKNGKLIIPTGKLGKEFRKMAALCEASIPTPLVTTPGCSFVSSILRYKYILENVYADISQYFETRNGIIHQTTTESNKKIKLSNEAPSVSTICVNHTLKYKDTLLSEPTFKKALKAVLRGEMSERGASIHYNVSRWSIRSRTKNIRSGKVNFNYDDDDDEPEQENKSAPKNVMKIYMPMLNNPIVRRTAEQVSGKPFPPVPIPVETKQILNDKTGLFESVPLTEEDKAQDNTHEVAFEPWPQSDTEPEIEEKDDDDDFFRELCIGEYPPLVESLELDAISGKLSSENYMEVEENSESSATNKIIKPKHRLTKKKVQPRRTSVPSPHLTNNAIINTIICTVLLNREDINNYYNKKKSKVVEKEKQTTEILLGTDDYHSQNQQLVPLPLGSDESDVKRSHRIRRKPKLDFSTGTVRKIPNHTYSDDTSNATTPPSSVLNNIPSCKRKNDEDGELFEQSETVKRQKKINSTILQKNSDEPHETADHSQMRHKKLCKSSHITKKQRRSSGTSQSEDSSSDYFSPIPTTSEESLEDSGPDYIQANSINAEPTGKRKGKDRMSTKFDLEERHKQLCEIRSRMQFAAKRGRTNSAFSKSNVAKSTCVPMHPQYAVNSILEKSARARFGDRKSVSITHEINSLRPSINLTKICPRKIKVARDPLEIIETTEIIEISSSSDTDEDDVRIVAEKRPQLSLIRDPLRTTRNFTILEKPRPKSKRLYPCPALSINPGKVPFERDLSASVASTSKSSLYDDLNGKAFRGNEILEENRPYFVYEDGENGVEIQSSISPQEESILPENDDDTNSFLEIDSIFLSNPSQDHIINSVNASGSTASVPVARITNLQEVVIGTPLSDGSAGIPELPRVVPILQQETTSNPIDQDDYTLSVKDTASTIIEESVNIIAETVEEREEVIQDSHESESNRTTVTEPEKVNSEIGDDQRVGEYTGVARTNSESGMEYVDVNSVLEENSNSDSELEGEVSETEDDQPVKEVEIERESEGQNPQSRIDQEEDVENTLLESKTFDGKSEISITKTWEEFKETNTMALKISNEQPPCFPKNTLTNFIDKEIPPSNIIPTEYSSVSRTTITNNIDEDDKTSAKINVLAPQSESSQTNNIIDLQVDTLDTNTTPLPGSEITSQAILSFNSILEPPKFIAHSENHKDEIEFELDLVLEEAMELPTETQTVVSNNYMEENMIVTSNPSPTISEFIVAKLDNLAQSISSNCTPAIRVQPCFASEDTAKREKDKIERELEEMFSEDHEDHPIISNNKNCQNFESVMEFAHHINGSSSKQMANTSGSSEELPDIGWGLGEQIYRGNHNNSHHIIPAVPTNEIVRDSPPPTLQRIDLNDIPSSNGRDNDCEDDDDDDSKSPPRLFKYGID